MSKPRIGLILGDPCGIGPEVAVQLLARPTVAEKAEVLVYGDRAVFAAGQRIAGAMLSIPEVDQAAELRQAGGSAFQHVPFAGLQTCPAGGVAAQAGAHVLDLLRLVTDTVSRGDLDAMVFAPLNKQAMMEGGLSQEDELRFLTAHLEFQDTVCELNMVDELWSSRVTSHIPISQVAANLSVGAIVEAAEILHRTLKASGVAEPRIAISALNPHAGEGGRFGREEIEVIGPAVAEITACGIDAVGPLPADTVFVRAQRDGLNGVVSMFHDQCQIALKLLGFDRGITVLAGLPFPVTTPAHGTAFDIIGQGVANSEPMSRAFDMAVRLAGGGNGAGR